MSPDRYFQTRRSGDTSKSQTIGVINKALFEKNSQPLTKEEEEKRKNLFLSKSLTYTSYPYSQTATEENVEKHEKLIADEVIANQTAHLLALGKERHEWKLQQQRIFETENIDLYKRRMLER